MEKAKNIALFKNILITCLMFFALISVWIIYPGEIVIINGDRHFEGAKVYESDKLIATMEWDDESGKTYAKEIRPLGQFSIQKGLDELKIPIDSLKMKIRAGDFKFKVVTKDGQVYEKEYFNMEDVGYIAHDLSTFELVEK